MGKTIILLSIDLYLQICSEVHELIKLTSVKVEIGTFIGISSWSHVLERIGVEKSIVTKKKELLYVHMFTEISKIRYSYI